MTRYRFVMRYDDSEWYSEEFVTTLTPREIAEGYDNPYLVRLEQLEDSEWVTV